MQVAMVADGVLEQRRRLHPDERQVELSVRRDGELVATGTARSPVLGVTFETVAGPALRLTRDGGSAAL